MVDALVRQYVSPSWYVKGAEKTKGIISEYGQAIAFLVLGAAMVVRFVYWGNHPSIVSASVFWSLSTVYGILFIITAPSILRRIGWVIMWIGGRLNMIVTLANRGFMPVVGGEETQGIWVTATEAHKLLFLADRFWGFSIGDFILMSGLGFLIISLLIGKFMKNKETIS